MTVSKVHLDEGWMMSAVRHAPIYGLSVQRNPFFARVARIDQNIFNLASCTIHGRKVVLFEIDCIPPVLRRGCEWFLERDRGHVVSYKDTTIFKYS